MNNDLKVANFHANQMKKMTYLMRKFSQEKKVIPELTLKEVEKYHEDKANNKVR